MAKMRTGSTQSPAAVPPPPAMTVPPPPLPAMAPSMPQAGIENGVPAFVPPVPPVQMQMPAPPPIKLPSPPPGLNVNSFVPPAPLAGLGNIPGLTGDAINLDLGSFDLTGIEVGSFKILPVDLTYEAVIKDAEVEISSGKQEKMIKLTLEVSFPLEFAGVKIWDYVTTGIQSLWKLKSLAAACDMLSEDRNRIEKRDDLGNVAPMTVKDFIENVVRFTIRHQEYQGKTTNKVDGGYEIAYETPGLEPLEFSVPNAG